MSVTTRSIVSKEDATCAVLSILNGTPSEFDLVSFRGFRAHTKLRSQRYNRFEVLCYKNTRKSSGWMVCPYVRNKGCNLSSGIMSFNSALGGTGKFERHAKSHAKASLTRINMERSIPAFSKATIAKAAAYAVAYDLRPMSFTDNKKGIRMFASAVFGAGQNTPAGDRIDPSSYLPTLPTVAKALKGIADDNRDEYKSFLLENMYETGGGLSTDGVTLNVQDRQFQDFTLHCIEVSAGKGLDQEVNVTLKVVTLLLKEKPDIGDGLGIRQMLYDHLKSTYGKDIDWITKRFTMVTDCASVMARVALSSVSSRLAKPDARWMGCFAHQLNTAMKGCISSLAENPDLQNNFADVQNVKKIVRIFKQSGLNGKLPNGFHLKQECETRFSTTFTVVERFIKSAEKVKQLLDNKGSTAAKDAFASLVTESLCHSSRVRFPALQAILNAFQVLVDTQKRVQAANTPTLHLALPLYHRCLEELDRIADRGSILIDSESALAPPGRLSRKLCRVLMEWLEAKIRIHPLWLVGCFLPPFLREFQFVSDMEKRKEYRKTAGEMTRALMESYNTRSDGADNSDVTNAFSEHTELGNSGIDSAPVIGRKRMFSLLDYADSHFEPAALVDEVSRYNSMDIGVLGLDRKGFMQDEFATVKFWYKRKSTYPTLYRTVCRVYAIPVSSCSSERVFSALNRIVTRDRASTGAETVENIIVVRSLTS